MKKRITILHTRPAKVPPTVVLPEDHDCVYRAVHSFGNTTAVVTNNTLKNLLELDLEGMIGTFFRRIVASNKVWYVTGHYGELAYPYYVEFRGDHYRFVDKDEAYRFADEIGGALVHTTRARTP